MNRKTPLKNVGECGRDPNEADSYPRKPELEFPSFSVVLKNSFRSGQDVGQLPDLVASTWTAFASCC